MTVMPEKHPGQGPTGSVDVVSIWNTEDMAARLEEDGVDVTTFIYPRHTHGSFQRAARYPADYAPGVSHFLRDVGYE